MKLRCKQPNIKVRLKGKVTFEEEINEEYIDVKDEIGEILLKDLPNIFEKPGNKIPTPSPKKRKYVKKINTSFEEA